jgi:hypothetical protein
MKEKWSKLETKCNKMSTVFDSELELTKIILKPDKVEGRKKVSPLRNWNSNAQTQREEI